MARGKVVLMVVVCLAVAAAAASAASGGGHSRGRPGKSARLQLVPAAPGASMAERARDDRRRHEYISARLAASRRRRRAEETSSVSSAGAVAASAFAMPLSSGAYTGTGQYFVRFRVGTPGAAVRPHRRHRATTSPGSSAAAAAFPSHATATASPSGGAVSGGGAATGVPSRRLQDVVAHPVLVGDVQVDHPLLPRQLLQLHRRLLLRLPVSILSSPRHCHCHCHDSISIDARVDLISQCSDPRARGSYNDNSAAPGLVGTDSATVALSGGPGGGGGGDRKANLQGVVLGSTTAHAGQGFEASDGVLSLGYSKISYLTFGAGPDAASSSAPAPGSRTPLLLDARVRPFYAVAVDSVSVDGVALDIPAEVWDVGSNGGTIIDSGTSLTVLATPAYKAVVAALSEQLAGLPRVAMDPFDYCYNWTARGDGGGDLAVPKLAVQFAGSARLEPPAKSYVIDAAPGVKCIGVQEGAWPGVSVIGNILQQEHLWEFDLNNRWLRFRQTSCTQ
ncbi:hypothetical protein OsJ_19503 [Oryza sativa Japonica Group]|uniref:Peptidase A1 domain-containing protein n=1 Tax=Oryza sativa subsp. japonica TaxID=39947 RepID=B9FLJ8_ORYSJ|nr:hypothetical protein OsJ_19503 [Oryza sativa Japonica Group]